MADEYGLVEKSKIMDAARMKRALSRLASEIVEANHGAKDLYIVGIRRRGVPLAERIVEKIEELEGENRFTASSTSRFTATIFPRSAPTRSSTARSSTSISKTRSSF
jgi:hypothetical protein